MEEISNGTRLLVQMKDNGGDGIKNKIIPTHVWLRGCEIQIEANKNQKIGVQRENGLLAIYFWTTGVTENSAPDHRVVIPPLGMGLKLEELE